MLRKTRLFNTILFFFTATLLIPAQPVFADSSEPAPVPNEVVHQVIDYFIFGELINQELVEDYVPFEFSEAAPLLISGHLLSGNINLSKFGKSVQLRAHEELGNNPYIYFERFTITNPDKATAIFKYVNGGLLGEFTFERDRKNKWELKNVNVKKD